MEEAGVKVASKAAQPATAKQDQQQQGLSNPITRKLNKILDSRIENDKVTNSIIFLSIRYFFK
jgi:hypothetical protein